MAHLSMVGENCIYKFCNRKGRQSTHKSTLNTSTTPQPKNQLNMGS